MKKRILFVDDEPNVLQGLQRMLRPLRDEWDMVFVSNGTEALNRLAQEPFDVIVSDMRMPGMDGAQLLTEVSNRHPEVVRIVLSGQANMESVLKAVEPTHQYLAKPCDPDTLKTVVSRTNEMRALLTDRTLKGLVAGMKALPSLPSLFLQVMEELKSPDASIQKIAKLISQDMGMSAKILQLVNSAYFGLRRRVDDLDRAISLLGLETIKTLVLSVHLFSQCDQHKLKRFALHTLWDHSFATGTLARMIARVEKQEQAIIDAAFMAGLLHDCGKLVLATNATEAYEKALAAADEQGLTTEEAERATIGISHAEVGAYLLGLWGLPDTIIEALAFHHHPSSCQTRMFRPLTAVHAADVLVNTATTPCSRMQLDLDYLTELGVQQQLALWQEQCATILQ